MKFGKFNPHAVSRYNPQSHMARLFLDLYLDPFVTDIEIQKKLKISRSTFYRLKKQSNVPIYKLSLWSGSSSSSSSKVKLLNSASFPLQNYNVKLFQEIRNYVPVKFILSFDSYRESSKKLSSGDIDIAINGITNLGVRNTCSNLFTYQYIEARPLGCLFGLRGGRIIKPQAVNLVGVLVFSMHDKYFDQLPQDYNKQRYTHIEDAMKGLREGHIEYIFCHPSLLKNNSDLELQSEKYYFDGYPAIAINEQNIDLHSAVNRALDQMNESGFYQKLNQEFKSYFN